MKKALLLSSLIFVFLTTVAFSAEGTYVSGNIGAVFIPDYNLTDTTSPGTEIELEASSGTAFGIAVGHDYGNNIRAEAELAYQKNDFDKAVLNNAYIPVSGDISSFAVLLNGYYDFPSESIFTPFIGAGIGFAQIDVSNFNAEGSGIPNESTDDTVFAYQVGVGVGYAFSEKITIDVKYRFFGTSDPTFNTNEAEYGSHNISLGLRVGF